MFLSLMKQFTHRCCSWFLEYFFKGGQKSVTLMFFICVYISIIHSVTVNSCFIGHFVVIDEQLNHKFKCHLGYISNTVTMVKSQQINAYMS